MVHCKGNSGSRRPKSIGNKSNRAARVEVILGAVNSATKYNITISELLMMAHTTSNKHRNHYAAPYSDKRWHDLIGKGYARLLNSYEGFSYYELTTKGIELITEIRGMLIVDGEFKDKLNEQCKQCEHYEE